MSLAFGVLIGAADRTDARREVLTEAQKERLRQAERLQLEALALNDRGPTDPASIRATVTARLQGLGYTVVPDPAQPHDVVIKVKCEQKKTWAGPVRSGTEADQPDFASSRLWTGPACQFSYRFDQKWMDWHHEVRGTDPQAGTQALTQLNMRLAEDAFPHFLAAEFGQSGRLLTALNRPDTPMSHKTAIMTLLGNMAAVEAIPALSQAANDRDPVVVKTAAVALGTIGHHDCVPVLLELLKNEDPAVHLAAIQGLGRLAPLHPESAIVPTLLETLPKESPMGQIEVVRALGKTTDRRILGPLRALNRSVQAKGRLESTPELKELTTALGQALDQFDGTHTPD
jgi:hypothetical protein